MGSWSKARATVRIAFILCDASFWHSLSQMGAVIPFPTRDVPRLAPMAVVLPVWGFWPSTGGWTRADAFPG